MRTSSTSRGRGAYVLIAVVAVFTLLVGGYYVGRDMAHRDNARAQATR
ncbi:hypothetical protein [Lysobacter claricitrinus]